MPVKNKERNIISDKLTIEKTGFDLEHWFAVLDKKGAKAKTHAQIFSEVKGIKALVALGEWNQNLLTTTYEWKRGLKGRGEKKDGFEISVSKTILVPLPVLYDSFISKSIRKKWLAGEEIEFRKITENKSARVTWSDGVTSLSVDFYEKGTDKSQIVLQHLKIQNAVKAGELKEFWSQKLQAFKLLLES